MLIILVLTCSVLFQFLAVLYALRLIKLTGKARSWILISFALVLMMVRRMVSLYYLLFAKQTYDVDLNNELIGLLLSLFMFCGIVGIKQIFIARLKAEEEASRSAKNVYYLSKYANDIIILLDENFRFLEVNERVVDFYGYAHEELIGMHASQLRPSDIRGEFIDQIKLVQTSDRAIYETVHQRKDGTVFPVEISVHAITSEGKRFYQAIIRDITERKHAEGKLQRAYRALQTISECNKLLVHAVDEAMLLNGICRILVDQGGYRVAWIGLVEHDDATTVRPVAQFGFETGDLDMADFVSAGREGEIDPVGTALRTGRYSISRNIHMERSNFAWREAAVKKGSTSSIAVPVCSNDKTIGVLIVYAAQPDSFNASEVAFLIELTKDLMFGLTGLRTKAEHARAEEEIRELNNTLEQRVIERTAQLAEAMEKARSADRLKSAFLATMSHELRTPLNSIIGFTGILIQRMGGPLTDEQDKQLKMVYNSAKHLLDLINDVLDISKIEAEQLNVVSETFSLSDSLEKVIKSAKPLADKKGIELSLSSAPEVGSINSDCRRVEQILLNLISNAIKFTEQGFVRMNCRVENGKVIIAVEDSGIGIKPEDMEILFNAFQQIETGITRKYDGTGLGLSISKKLAHLLGGEITVESEWGVGSTFSLILPIEGEKE